MLRDWNKTTGERAKLQHCYAVLVVITTIVAGLVTLLNAELGHTIILCAGFLLLAFIGNAVIWALLKSFVLDRLAAKRTSK